MDGHVYTYQQQILDALAGHGLIPAPHSSPQQLRDAVRDLYKYEIRRLRGRLISGEGDACGSTSAYSSSRWKRR